MSQTLLQKTMYLGALTVLACAIKSGDAISYHSARRTMIQIQAFKSTKTTGSSIATQDADVTILQKRFQSFVEVSEALTLDRIKWLRNRGLAL